MFKGSDKYWPAVLPGENETMNLFQIIISPITIIGLLWCSVKCLRGPGRYVRMVNGFLAMIWATACLLIIRPELSSMAARMFGIGRGVDLVLYVFILVAFGYGIVLYYRLCDIRRDITRIVRHMAITECRRLSEVENVSESQDGEGSE